MEDVKDQPRLLLPSLKPFYDRVIPLSWLVIRIAVAAGKERTCPQPGMNPWNRRSPSHFHRSGIGAMI